MISTNPYLTKHSNQSTTTNNNNIVENNIISQKAGSKKKHKKKASHRAVLEAELDEVTMDSEETSNNVTTNGTHLADQPKSRDKASRKKQQQQMRQQQLLLQQQQQQNQQQRQQQRQQQQQQQEEEQQLEEPENMVCDGEEEKEESEYLESFLLIDENELMQVNSPEEFAEKLGCQPDSLIKVVSIFGSIGHGKSYTLNSTFYDNAEVFQTSSSQDSCTIGIWAAYDEIRRVITLDTEGLLGISSNCQRRTRLLLKVLAISDIVIYRTKSERLEDNLFTFLGDASRVYVQHFFKEMKNAFQRLPELNEHPFSELGPVVIIFQETRDTEPLKAEPPQTRESIIRSRFKTLGLTTEAFSAIEYVGIQTIVRPTDFNQLKVCIKKHIKNWSTRAPRPASTIYTTLRVLNEKFNGDIERTVPSMFPNQYLTCPTTCLSCNARCVNSMNHHRDGLCHHTETKCIYQHQFNNHVLYCRACYERGDEVIVTPKTCSSNESPWIGLAKYAWSGYVLECPRCGIIHRSRQYWFGNKVTWESSVRTEIKHVWPGQLNKMQAAQNAAQRVVDSVSYLTDAVTSMSAKPTKMVSEWVADQIAPKYWIPNSRLLRCALCSNEFGELDQKHHCRLCGNGLCSTCSSKSKPVPERGWGETSVRVCDRCYERSDNLTAISSLPPLPTPMLLPPAHQQQSSPTHQASNAGTPTTNGFYAKTSTTISAYDCHQQKSNQQQSNKTSKNSKPNSSSNSIPIPTNRGAGCSNNVTPTPHSSSVGSSSSGSNNSSNNHQPITGESSHYDSRNHRDSSSSSHCNSPTKQQHLNGLIDDCADGEDQPMMDFDTPPIIPCGANNDVGSYSQQKQQMNGVDATVTARKLGEVLQSTLKTVVSTAIDYPLGVIKDSARPEYWLPDSQISDCGSCKKNFNELITIHHCRRCGGGFCNECSTKSMPVPERGWGDTNVRVCDKCYQLK